MYEFYQSLPYIVLVSFAVFISTGIILACMYSEEQLDMDNKARIESQTKAQRLVSTTGALAAAVFFVFGAVLLIGKAVEYLV